MRQFTFSVAAALLLPAVAAAGGLTPGGGDPAADGAWGLALAATVPASVAAAARETLAIGQALEAATTPVAALGVLATTHAGDARLRQLADVAAAANKGDAFAAARAGITIGAPVLTPPARAASAVAAFEALAEANGHDLPPETRAALVAILAPLDAASEHAVAALVAAAVQQHAALAAGPAAVAAAHAHVLAAAEHAANVLRPAPTGFGSVALCGVFAVDLSGLDDHWSCPVAFSLDVGGDDVYANNAGASMAPPVVLPPAAESARDVACLVACGPSLDPFHCRSASCPATAVFVDLAGNDAYTGTLAHSSSPTSTFMRCLGAAATVGGASVLVDVAGDDVYAPDGSRFGCREVKGIAFAQGLFEAPVAAATLVDVAGNDTYELLGHEFGGGIGLAVGGQRAVLVDGAGDDAYRYDGKSLSHAVAVDGFAFLADLGGRDTYASNASTSFAVGMGVAGVALLFDGGDSADRFLSDPVDNRTAIRRTMGVGDTLGAGVLVVEGGDNTFHAPLAAAAGPGRNKLAQGAAGGYRNALGFGTPVTSTSGAPYALGALIAGGGDDVYTASGNAQGSAAHAARAFLLDTGGRNTYAADHDGGSGVRDAQGAARYGAVALLGDFGDGAAFTIGPGVAGQGAGAFGVGTLYQANAERLTTYTAAAGSLPSHVVGAATGLRVTRGESLLFGVIPDFACNDSTEIWGFTSTVIGNRAFEFHACTPNQSSKEQLRNPLSGDEVADAPKPPVPCRSGVLNDEAQCDARVTDLLGPQAVDFLEDNTFTMQASGGLAWISDVKSVNGRYTVTEADNTCRFSCDALWSLAS